MAPRSALLIAVLTTLAVACAPAARHARAAPARPDDPDRWARAACLRDEYPTELDGRAYAAARQQDRTAERKGQASSFATARLRDRRAEFDARCVVWREQAAVMAAADRPGR